VLRGGMFSHAMSKLGFAPDLLFSRANSLEEI
jgi:hypothetical protein